MKKICAFIISNFLIISCTVSKSIPDQKNPNGVKEVKLILLGTVQDGGSPHIGCKLKCCKKLFKNPKSSREVVSLGLIDYYSRKRVLFECTPDFPRQAKELYSYSSWNDNEMPDAIFITHGHIGHYTGLMHLGKEAKNADAVPVYLMPRMQNFIEQNGPWSQLVLQKNISIQQLDQDLPIELADNIKVTPFVVPHRDEFSETVGFIIEGPNKKVLFIPDIDKWDKWGQDIIKLIALVDYALLDGTFYSEKELNNRDIRSIPHPFIIESMELFKDLPKSEKKKVHFIHFNHTNPVLNKFSKEYKTVIRNGFHIAKSGQIINI